jgi:hypothetical protein
MIVFLSALPGLEAPEFTAHQVIMGDIDGFRINTGMSRLSR